MKKFKAKNYTKRADLDADVLTMITKNIGNDRKEAVIEGTAKELKKLHLSEKTTVHGININLK